MATTERKKSRTIPFKKQRQSTMVGKEMRTRTAWLETRRGEEEGNDKA